MLGPAGPQKLCTRASGATEKNIYFEWSISQSMRDTLCYFFFVTEKEVEEEETCILAVGYNPTENPDSDH